jgi:signal transduction histidine kinase
MTIGSALTALSWVLPGWVVGTRRPELPFGWLLLAGGLFLAAGVAASSYGATAAILGWPAAAWVAWAGGWIFFPHLGCQEAVYLLFPTGHLPSPRWRKVMVAVVAVNAVMVVAAAFSGGRLAETGPLSHLVTPVHGFSFFEGAFPVLAAAQNVLNLMGMWVIFRRWRSAAGSERAVLGAVLALGALDAAVGLLLIAPIAPWIFLVAVPSTMGLTTAIAWGVLRHRLWDVRLIVRRTVTWLLLTGTVVAILALGVALTGLAAGGAGGLTLGLVVASALVTIVVVPLERHLRRAVDRLLFGNRLEPYAVLSTLGAEVEAAGDPVDALERLVAGIRSSLKVSYAAVELVERDGSPTVAAATGSAPDEVLRLPVRHHGTDMGFLVVGQQAGDRPFTVSNRRLLEDLARQAGAAAASVALTTALQQSRQRLVNAREEERRRLRRELHDGVASALTAIGLKVDSAASIVVGDAVRAQGILDGVQADVGATLSEVRRVVTDLRPPALEDLGLVGALGQLASRYDSTSLRVAFTCEGADRSRLRAAVELALYRIANEALQNVARHAHATSCTLRLAVKAHTVALTIEDDGNGLIGSNGAGGGLGLAGMAERADELGGTLAVGQRATGRGSVVSASLPIGAAP